MSELPARWPAPAKLNLLLHITGRRQDGYHDLQTAFQFLDRSDHLTFESRQDGEITLLSGIPGVTAESNLIVRAARLLKDASNVRDGVDITLEKILPMGAGLGGGSSNAATTLVALNRLWSCGFSADELAELGLSLGADVPVFVRGYACWAEGVGEIITPISLPELWYVVLVPDEQIETAALFSSPDLTRDCSPITIRDFLAGRGGNVFQPVASKIVESVREALTRLNALAEKAETISADPDHRIAVAHSEGLVNRLTQNAQLTGTGSCVYLAARDERSARQLLSLALNVSEPNDTACDAIGSELTSAAGREVGSGLSSSRLSSKQGNARSESGKHADGGVTERPRYTGFIARGLNRSPLLIVR